MSGDPERPPGRPDSDRFDALATAIAVGLILARWLMPTESAAAGETGLIVTAWIALAVVVLVRDRRAVRGVRFDRVDLAVLAIAAAFCLSGLVTVFRGANLRSALNLTSEWLGTGIAVVLTRRLLGDRWRERFVRPLVALMVGLSAFGLYQHFVWYPAIASRFAEFESLADADHPLTASERSRLSELSADLGPVAAMRDERARDALRQRVAFSSEPLGYFGLTNTFAVGPLVTLLLMGPAFRRLPGRSMLIAAAAAGLVATCFLLTKSRTAYVGLACGLAVLGVMAIGRRKMHDQGSRDRLSRGGWVGVGVFAVVGCVAAATLSGSLDAEVLTEAPKSLRYRLEYWIATGGMLLEHPIVGAGLGQFRSHYLAHKLPGASEEVSDPHNWLLEAWATGGMLGLVLSVAAIAALLVWGIRRGDRSFSKAKETGPPSLSHSDSPLVAIAIAGSLALAVAQSGFVTAAIAAGVVVLPLPWDRVGTGRTALAAAVAIGVHLLGAGGFGFPAIVQVWLLLLVLPLPRLSDRALSGRAVSAMAAVLIVVGLGQAWLVARANLDRDAKMGMAEFAAMRGDLVARSLAQQAAAADPLSPKPYVLLSQVELTTEARIAALREALARDPRQAYLYERLALMLDETGDAEGAAAAIAEATRLYPNSTRLQAKRATLAIDPAERWQAAERAIALDDAMIAAGHATRTLDATTRDALVRMLQSGDSGD